MAIPTDRHGVMHLAYYGPGGTFRHLSAADVLTGAAPPAVTDHLVLVGFTAQGMDTRATPFDASMPGVEIHATALGNILEGRGLRRPAAMRIVEALAVLLLATSLPLALPRLGPASGTALAAGLAAFVVGLGSATFRRGVLVSVLPPLAALAVGYVGCLANEAARWRRRVVELETMATKDDEGRA